MNERQQRMLDAFADYEHTHHMSVSDRTIGMQPGARLQRIVKLMNGWQLWIATRDFIHGSTLYLQDNGSVMRYDVSPDQEDINIVRPSDDEIRRNMR